MKGTTWNYSTIYASGTPGREHGVLSFDNNGLGSMSVSRDRSVITSLILGDPANPGMFVALRRGEEPPEEAPDLDGIWQFHRFTAGSDNTDSGWRADAKSILDGGGTR